MDKTLRMDKERTALVVIDLQKGVVAMETQTYSTKEVIWNAFRLATAWDAGVSG